MSHIRESKRINRIIYSQTFFLKATRATDSQDMNILPSILLCVVAFVLEGQAKLCADFGQRVSILVAVAASIHHGTSKCVS